jgi:hypothetical protein
VSSLRNILQTLSFWVKVLKCLSLLLCQLNFVKLNLIPTARLNDIIFELGSLSNIGISPVWVVDNSKDTHSRLFRHSSQSSSMFIIQTPGFSHNNSMVVVQLLQNLI